MDGHAEKRQTKMRDGNSISQGKKDKLSKRLDLSESFSSSGLNLEMFDLSEFWANSKLCASTNELFVDIGMTTHTSCDAALSEYFSKVDDGMQPSSAKFRDLSRRAAVAEALANGVFARRNCGDDTTASMRAKIMTGRHDDDVAGILGDTTDIDESDQQSFDNHLMWNYAVVEDAIELGRANSQQPGGHSQGDPSAGATAGEGLTDTDWIIKQVEHGLDSFNKSIHESDAQASELARAEGKFESEQRSNAAAATQSFLNQFVKFVEPMIADPLKFGMDSEVPFRLKGAFIANSFGAQFLLASEEYLAPNEFAGVSRMVFRRHGVSEFAATSGRRGGPARRSRYASALELPSGPQCGWRCDQACA